MEIDLGAAALHSTLISGLFLIPAGVFFYVLARDLWGVPRVRPSQLGRWCAAWMVALVIWQSASYFRKGLEQYFYELALLLVPLTAFAFAGGFIWRKLNPLKTTANAAPRGAEASPGAATPAPQRGNIPLWLAVTAGAALCAVAIFAYQALSSSGQGNLITLPVASDPTVVYRLTGCERCETSTDAPRSCRLLPTHYYLVNPEAKSIEMRYYQNNGTYESSLSGSECSVGPGATFRCRSGSSKSDGPIHRTWHTETQLVDPRYLSTSNRTSEVVVGKSRSFTRHDEETRCTVERAKLPS